EVELSVLTTPPLALASPLPSLPLREPLATFSRWLGWVLHGVPLEGCTRIFAPLHLTPDRSLGSPAIDCSRQAEYAALACAWSAVAELEVAVGEGEMQRCTQIVAGLRLLLQAAAEDDQRALEAAELKLAPLVADQSHDDLFE
ncbi:MAG: hypothetical protein SGPRY_009966, partial [Prymnesium sp.]